MSKDNKKEISAILSKGQAQYMVAPRGCKLPADESSAREVLQCLNSSGLSTKKIAQTFIPGSHLNDMREGHGQCVFVGVSGEKYS